MDKKINDDRYKLLEEYKHMQIPLTDQKHLYDYLVDFYNANKQDLVKYQINSETQFIHKVVRQFLHQSKYPDIKIVDYLPSNQLTVIKCKKCDVPFYHYAYLVPCEHFICKSCMLQQLKLQDNALQCPFCQQDIYSLSKSQKIDEVISELTIKCPRTQCDWQGKFNELDQHIEEQHNEMLVTQSVMYSGNVIDKQRLISELKNVDVKFTVQEITVDKYQPSSSRHPHFVYQFKISTSTGFRFQLDKRFNQFKALSKQIQIGGLPNPFTWWYFGGSSENFAKQRLPRLGRWLQNVLVGKMRTQPVVYQFLLDQQGAYDG